ncbi:hypothetical protein BP5796_07511 [Coleophoma crateriformis]|uniref:Uncharacterized protein n=1 Tax=Coleophoma crateriformis TaxID=565419 RepID=A0A3D8RJ39_9HELO|nr:hypothetical protein BP5796_07511 [Coleophoma crateriformis]
MAAFGLYCLEARPPRAIHRETGELGGQRHDVATIAATNTVRPPRVAWHNGVAVVRIREPVRAWDGMGDTHLDLAIPMCMPTLGGTGPLCAATG